MENIINLGSFLTTNLFYASLAFASAALLLSGQKLYGEKLSKLFELAAVVLTIICITYVTYQYSNHSIFVLFLLVAGISAFGMIRRFFPDYTAIGQFFFTAYLLLLTFGLFWGGWFIATIPVSNMTRLLMVLGAPLLIFTLPSGVVQFIEQFDVLCRKYWARPRTALTITPRAHYPKVSFHVPTYSEPPNIVIETLTLLSQMDYPYFEVLVIYNNTEDETLWKPVADYCQSLGERFCFFHVEKLEGAKAGALNYALQKTSEDAEIISVIDADYHAKPDFLKSLIGYFDDPTIGFVQTPHDYREWESNAYLRMCYFEYKIFFHSTMATLNEKGAVITVGTMCLIRKQALKQAGGWAEWCVTEDSELAIRIHALGYSSIYLTQSFGKGLIPETFAGYKKQRHRWTAGPVQEFKHHFNLLMLWPWHQPSLLTLTQRIHHFNHGFDRFNVGLGVLLTPIMVAIITSMVIHKEIVQVPFTLWLTATITLVSGFVLNVVLYRVTLGCGLKDTVGALIASKSLSHTISVASVQAIFKSCMPWHRTSKFRTPIHLLRAIATTKTELSLGIFLLLVVIFAFYLVPFPGLLLMLLIGIVYRAFDYLTAPLLAILAERSILRNKPK